MSYGIYLIGVSGAAILPEARDVLAGCSSVVASSRHASLVSDTGLPVIPIAPVREMLVRLEAALKNGNTAVLASGDPMFFGVGRTLVSRFGEERIKVYPAISSLQLACARFRVPWDDIAFMSLHGRSPGNIAARVLEHCKVAILTDSVNSPARIAADICRRLEETGDNRRLAQTRVMVGENLGLEDERLFSGTLREAAARQFGPMNIMLVMQPEDMAVGGSFRLGLSEEEINHSRGLITKNEVRAVTLHALRLPSRGVFWDVGAGSGSVSIEAARINPGLQIFSVEKRRQEQENILKNIRRFGCYNINLIKGVAPGALHGLPAPDAVFIGGSSGMLSDIVDETARRISPGGRVVINAVTEETERLAPDLLLRQGFKVFATRVQVSRIESGGYERRFNTITVTVGVKCQK